jgi:hypothetical protein
VNKKIVKKVGSRQSILTVIDLNEGHLGIGIDKGATNWQQRSQKKKLSMNYPLQTGNIGIKSGLYRRECNILQLKAAKKRCYWPGS